MEIMLLFTADFPQGIFVRFLHENPGQQCAKCDRRKHLHSVRLRCVHFVAMNSGAVNSNEIIKEMIDDANY